MAESRASRGGDAPPSPPRRGTDATGPHHLRAAQWRRVLRRTVRHVLSDRLQVASAGISFFAVLSIAPVLVTALSLYGALNTPEQALAQLSDMASSLPDDLEPIVADQLTTITTASGDVLTWRGISGLLVALWTATTAATYLVDALTLAYHETETRGFLRRSGIGLVLVLGGALLVGAVIAGGGLVSRALSGAPGAVRTTAHLLAWPAAAAVMAAALAVLYRYAPDRHDARWRWITPGAGLATLLWLVTSLGLFAYVQSLGNYESTYGSLAGVAISMFWLWLSVFLVIAGAAVNAEAEKETVRDSTVGPERPIGQRGAVVADSAPPYPGER
ncbi:YihY/virulence factor BrkB family protein [Blastococcus sp. URHD0036]|uniref:YihY/virulence factor BrkB family protein n=1 Tax=Blastococcus sp. URHD0036 TaxID=1380356 RepID=UPI0004957A87|nr:YihY/virulence factor BrkB family protein [Blastococcus sp. URHD0036]